MNEFDQDKLINNITKALDQSVEELDGTLQLRLDKIRSQSLQRPSSAIESDESLDPLFMAVKVSLDDSAQEINPDIEHRLNEIRKTALTQVVTRQQPESQTKSTLVNKLQSLVDTRRFAIPAGAFATACVLVTVVSLFYFGPSSTSLSDEDVILFASTDEFELYENLEFYEWLAENGASN